MTSKWFSPYHELDSPGAPRFEPISMALAPMLASMGTATAAAGATSAAAIATAPAAAIAATPVLALPSLTAVLGGLGLVGTTMSAFGQKQQGDQQAAILEANAKMERMAADSIQEQSKSQQFKLSQDRRKMLGSQVAITGGSGLDYSGSPMDVIEQTAKSFEDELQQLGYAGDTRARAKDYGADIMEWEAPNRRRAGWWNAAGTLLSGFGKYGMMRGAYA